jgi:hypothetical protein
MNGTQSQPRCAWQDGLDLIWREIARESMVTDQLVSHLETRVGVLEEVLAARGLRGLAVRWRAARDLRRSVAGYRWAGQGFRERRAQFISDTWDPPADDSGSGLSEYD